MAGGKWYSFFSGPTLEGGTGTLRFEQSGGRCGLALQFVFGSTVPSGDEGFRSYTDDLGHYQTYFSYGGPVPGPWLTSNGRLEREYMDAIRRAFNRRRRP
ncbi:MAG TPA: hypothetical protein VMJ34_10840 [Bryobacteraceae bacterium]|nr:hypothetical protein [Bryobacteraceae bacterium]